jgi:hypothetical protein
MRWFQPAEYRCSCHRPDCDAPLELDPRLAASLDTFRESVNRALVLTSALRCRRHNAEVGGVHDSQHLVGCAADIAIADDGERDELLAHHYNRPTRLFAFVEMAPKHLHVDVVSRGRPLLALGSG